LGTPIATIGAPATAASTSNPGSGYIWSFDIPAGSAVVPQGGGSGLVLVLKGTISSYANSGATDNTTHVFKIATSTESTNDVTNETVVALGNTSNATSVVSLSTGSSAPTANAVTVVRSKAVVSATALGGSSHSKGATDDLGTITFAADSAGSIALNTVTITFAGTAPSSPTFLDGVILLDQNGTNVVTSQSASVSTSSVCTTSASCTKTWFFGAANAGFQITGGTNYVYKLRIDSTKTNHAQSGVSQTLTATLNAQGAVAYTDGTDSAASININLPANVVPITINSVSYPQGS
jgi:hypothetical protein